MKFAVALIVFLQAALLNALVLPITTTTTWSGTYTSTSTKVSTVYGSLQLLSYVKTIHHVYVPAKVTNTTFSVAEATSTTFVPYFGYYTSTISN